MALGAALVAVFALLHGHAHGAELPAHAAAATYAAGFALATALLHGLGLGVATLCRSDARPPHRARRRRAGGRRRRGARRRLREERHDPRRDHHRQGQIELNKGRKAITLTVANTGDRPIQVGSHYHFAETNPALRFDREKARGHRLDIAAGTAVRFEPGQTREVRLVAFAGKREVYGFRQEVMGKL